MTRHKPVILLLGATGFIGCDIARDLLADGHTVRLSARNLGEGRRLFPDAPWVEIDLNQMTQAEDWAALLAGVDVVINASGLLQSGAGDSVARIQEAAIIAMAQGCAAAGVRRIIQISAAGIDGNASDFMTTKARADAALLAGTVPTVILRPGLVIGRNAYGGTQLVRMAAALPFALFPPLGAPIRCIALSDVVAAVWRALAAENVPDGPVDLVGEDVHSLSAIITGHRSWLGYTPWRRTWTLPAILLWLARIKSDVLGWFGWRSPLRSNAVAALANGVEGDTAATARWLGRAPLTLGATLAAMPAGKQDRLMALAMALLPIALVALGAMWLLSGISTLCDVDRAAAIMASGSVPEALARPLTIAGAVADIALALGLLWRRTVQPALIGMAALATLYLLLGSWLMPALWADPLAPLAKVLPSIALALLLHPLLAKR